MDGVIYHGNQLLPGVPKFLCWLRKERRKFLFLTNSSERSPRELREKMLRLTVQISEDQFYTSALATAEFLARQCPDGSAFVIGEAGLTKALYDAGFSMNDTNPDYVVVGETRNYSYDRLERAVHLVGNGATLIGPHPRFDRSDLKRGCPGHRSAHRTGRACRRLQGLLCRKTQSFDDGPCFTKVGLPP